MYLYQSVILCSKSFLTFVDNQANVSGGGINAVNSFIGLSYRGSIIFIRNHAQKNGGGIFVTGNTKISVLHQKYTADIWMIWDLRIRFINNSARNFGGGIYVDDDSNSVSCVKSNVSTFASDDGCFLQTFTNSGKGPSNVFRFLFVDANKAAKAGANIYGGFFQLL